MIHIIEHHSGLSALPLAEGIFADRKRLFVDLFGWELPVVDGRLAIDQFDGEHVAYIIAASPDGGHEASMRVHAEQQAHMLAEMFRISVPAAFRSAPIRGKAAGFACPSAHDAVRRKELRNELISAMVDYALARGIWRITGLIPENFRKEVLSMGWQADPLCPVVRVAGSPVGAFAIHVRSDTPTRLRWTGVYVGSETTVASLPCVETIGQEQVA